MNKQYVEGVQNGKKILFDKFVWYRHVTPWQRYASTV